MHDIANKHQKENFSRECIYKEQIESIWNVYTQYAQFLCICIVIFVLFLRQEHMYQQFHKF